ncbi:uncharacterized protein LOC110254303 [Exaiptasia diaphana]|uniref:NACHT domain-containing protein n=1 Tax=Exaiptasia diaphana TaxID=2652724 RepID=A0A913YX02_EXADI|nr:uncharacterized protein LOC110254303 [Exaiptasia diaphana]XP_028519598.1 uncharacterized protein LOC110254303 [Exaiptasia diaphana]
MLEETERNYCCLVLLLSRVGLEKLRQLFINEWNSAGGFVPWTDCPQNGTDLLTKFTPLPYEKAKVQSGDTTTWDLSLFVKALLYSAPPFVPKSKTALFAGLKCLKKTRNQLCHTGSGKIESAEFAILYADVCNALFLVGASANDFKQVEKDVHQPLREVLSLVKQCSLKDADILNGIGAINDRLELLSLQRPDSSDLSSEDVKLYSIKLKEAIAMQTDLLPRRRHRSRLKTDDIFTNLTVYQGKQNSQEKAQEDERARKTVTKIAEIFVGENGEGDPKSILVSGEPGIGKTLFLRKIVRDWSTDCISIPKIKFIFLITFRQLVLLSKKELALKELLNRSPLLNETTKMDEKLMDYIIQHPDQLFVALDGFDKYKDHSKLTGDFESQFTNDVETKMPVVALVSKLIQKKILRDSVIMITSRPGEANELDKKLHFDRCVEITGFSEEQVLQYVEKYFNSEPEEVKKMAMEKVKGSAHFMSFGHVPLRCFLMCAVIEYEIQNNITRDKSVPLKLTQFYCEVIRCLVKISKELSSLDNQSALSAVEKTLDNFSELAAQLAEQNRFTFTQKDLEELKLSEAEMSYLKSSSLIFCYPVASDSPFPQTTLEYCFSHLTIQEFFVACHLVKKRAMAAQETSEMVHIFTSGLLGLDQENNNDKLMSKVLKSVCKQVENEWRQRVVLLRCLREYGLEKEFTIQELTTNRDYRYWDSDGWIRLSGVTDDTDCDALAMLVEYTATSISLPPHTLYISSSQITITMLNRLLLSLHHSNSTITRLLLVWCSLNDEHVKCLCKYLPNMNITELDLSGNQITDVGVHHIIHHLSSNLTALGLTGNPISRECRKSIEFCNSIYAGLTYRRTYTNTEVSKGEILRKKVTWKESSDKEGNSAAKRSLAEELGVADALDCHLERISCNNEISDQDIVELEQLLADAGAGTWNNALCEYGIDKRSLLFAIARVFSFLKPKLEEYERMNNLTRSDIVDVTFLAHGGVSDPLLPCRVHFLNDEQIESVILYIPWGCKLDASAAYGIATGTITTTNVNFIGLLNEDKRLRCWNNLPMDGTEIPNIVFTRVSLDEVVIQQLQQIDSAFRRGVRGVFVPFLPEETNLNEIPLSILCIAVALCAYLKKVPWKYRIHIASCLYPMKFDSSILVRSRDPRDLWPRVKCSQYWDIPIVAPHPVTMTMNMDNTDLGLQNVFHCLNNYFSV